MLKQQDYNTYQHNYVSKTYQQCVHVHSYKIQTTIEAVQQLDNLAIIYSKLHILLPSVLSTTYTVNFTFCWRRFFPQPWGTIFRLCSPAVSSVTSTGLVPRIMIRDHQLMKMK